MSDMEMYVAAPPTPLTDGEWAMLERKAKLLAASSLVPSQLKGKPEDVLAIALSARDLGMDLTLTTMSQFYIIDGRVSPSAQLLVALAMQHGHETWWVESDESRATIAIRRAHSARVQTFSWTIEMAAHAGLLDEWVEKWNTTDSGKKYKASYTIGSTPEPPAWAKPLIASGDIRTRDNWRRYPADMLMARAAAKAVRHVCPEVTLGLANLAWPDDEAKPLAPDEEGAALSETPRSASLETDPLTPSPQPLVDQEWVNRLAHGVTKLAVEHGWDSDDLRHAIVDYATDGRTRSSREVLQGDETLAVAHTFAAVRDGELSLENTPDGPELVVVAGEAVRDG